MSRVTSHWPNCRSKSEMSHILVQSHGCLPESGRNAVPFSWRIRDYVEELWVQAQYISEATGVPGGPGGAVGAAGEPVLRLLGSGGPGLRRGLLAVRAQGLRPGRLSASLRARRALQCCHMPRDLAVGVPGKPVSAGALGKATFHNEITSSKWTYKCCLSEIQAEILEDELVFRSNRPVSGPLTPLGLVRLFVTKMFVT